MSTAQTAPAKSVADFVPGPKGGTGKTGNDMAVATLEAKLIELFESGDFAAALEFISKLHNYSLWNRLLIAAAYMERGYDGRMFVAGMKAWKSKHKRTVRKGSKAIWIFAPIFSRKDERDDAGNVTGKKVIDRLVGYTVVPVFAVQDTDGEPLPDFDIGGPLVMSEDNTDEARAALAALQAHAVTLEVPVAIEEDEYLKSQPMAHGYYHKVDKRIVLRPGTAAGHLAMVLAHELAHHVAHEQERKLGWDVGQYADHEIVAQGAAYVVCERMGIDVEGFTLPYVAGWGKDIARIRRGLWFVSKVADGVLPPQDATATID